MALTSDPTNPRLTHGADPADAEPKPQAPVYLVLSDEERAQGFVRPVRRTYWHQACGTTTTMGVAIAETYAREPAFYGSTYCVACGQHRPVGPGGEFYWHDSRAPSEHVEKVGT